jgi:hypothetical protein
MPQAERDAMDTTHKAWKDAQTAGGARPDVLKIVQNAWVRAAINKSAFASEQDAKDAFLE